MPPARSLVRTLGLGLLLVGVVPSLASAAPGEGGPRSLHVSEPTDLQTREQALARLVEGEASLSSDPVAGLRAMVEACTALERFDGSEAARVVELRSWLIEALALAGFVEVAELRARGRFVDHPLSVLPSTWFASSLGSIVREDLFWVAMNAEVERGLDLLSAGEVEGLVLLLQLYERSGSRFGSEGKDTVALRGHLVGILEAGGYADMAEQLRSEGSVVEPSEAERERHAAAWREILQAREQLVIDALRDASEGAEPEPKWDRTARSGPGAPLIVSPLPWLLVDFGGGSYTHERLGVLGGEALAGVGVLVGDDHVFVLAPSVGWSGWRALDKPSRLRANTFTGRVDLGYFNFGPHLQGFTVSCAGRIGTGRGPERGSDPTRLYGAQIGVTWWPVSNAVGLEFQANFINHLDVWREDLRFVVSLNVLAFWAGPLMMAASR